MDSKRAGILFILGCVIGSVAVANCSDGNTGRDAPHCSSALGEEEVGVSLLQAGLKRPVSPQNHIETAAYLGLTGKRVSARDKAATNATQFSCPPCIDLTASAQGPTGHACPPCALAQAWKTFNGGSYAGDCANAMAIALGEGVIPASPLQYISPGTWAGPADCLSSNVASGPPLSSVEAFAACAAVFNLDQSASDGQPTLGPWQTMTSTLPVTDVTVRIKEAIAYVESCCMDNVITADVSDATLTGGCNSAANCPNEVDGMCEANPNVPIEQYPLNTIFQSSLTPALTWCGCAVEGSATTGYSGRCSQSDDAFYQQYLDLGKQICDLV